MFGVCLTPGLQGDAPAAKSNVQAGSVFSAAGLQCCSAAVLQWAHGHGCRVMGHRGQCDCKAINCLHTSTQTFLHTKYAYKASWESSLIFRHVSVLEYLQNCQT